MNITREEAKRRAELYSALADGKAIQVQNPVTSKWEYLDINKIGEFMEELNYRIKPEPKFRPFKSQEECWQEMHQHPDFGWIKGKVTGEYKQVIRVFGCKTELIFNISYNSPADYSPEMMFSSYTFTDGTPFGIKEE